MKDSQPIVRSLDCTWDRDALRAFLDADDRARLDQIQPALKSGDAFSLVAEEHGRVIGWVVVHLQYRSDLGWEPDGDTVRFQSGQNAYVENLMVAPLSRNRGVGALLLAAAGVEAFRRRGKRSLWLHASEANEGACRFYEREGWTHHATVHPAWRQGRAMRVYTREIAADR